jgi:hypothetical protein
MRGGEGKGVSLMRFVAVVDRVSDSCKILLVGKKEGSLLLMGAGNDLVLGVECRVGP